MLKFDFGTVSFLLTLNELSNRMKRGTMSLEDYTYENRENNEQIRNFDGILYDGAHPVAKGEDDLDFTRYEIVREVCCDEIHHDIVSIYSHAYHGAHIWLCEEESGEKWILVDIYDEDGGESQWIAVDEEGLKPRHWL